MKSSLVTLWLRDARRSGSVFADVLIVSACVIGCSPPAPASAPTPPPASEPAPAAPAAPVTPPASPAPPTLTAAPAVDTESAAQSRPRPVVLDYTEIVELDSPETGRKYELWVALPPSFAKSPDRLYPTLYLLDGQWDFTLVRALAGGLLFDQVAPEFLIVGITYGGKDPNYGALRAEDYLPTRAKGEGETWHKGGDAKKFLSFIETRVLPLTEERYRADPAKRILSGASFGGLFTLFALFEKPELFGTYLALSPAVSWDDRWLFRREAEFHRAHPRLERRVWLSVGTDEWPRFTDANRVFFKQIEASRYQGITLRTLFIEGERHAGNKPEAYNRALRFAFEGAVPQASAP